MQDVAKYKCECDRQRKTVRRLEDRLQTHAGDRKKTHTSVSDKENAPNNLPRSPLRTNNKFKKLL